MVYTYGVRWRTLADGRPMAVDVSDDDLMRMYCDGDAEAFDALFDRHYRSVYNFARMMLGSIDGSDEVLQEAFLAVAQSAEQYEGRGRFCGWLMRIVRNRCLSRLAAQRVRQQMMAGSDLEIVEPASRGPGPAEQVEVDEQVQVMREAIGRLPQRQREAIVLYAFEQMSYAEIAQVLQMPTGTVKTLIHRARAGLAEMHLEQSEGDQT